jgi:hypothetical protein
MRKFFSAALEVMANSNNGLSGRGLCDSTIDLMMVIISLGQTRGWSDADALRHFAERSKKDASS